jgi:hypothetical protein
MKVLPLVLTGMLLLADAAAAQYKRAEVIIGRKGASGTLHLYCFDTRRINLKVIDQGDLADPKFADLGEAMKANKCLAGCNGSPVDGNGDPLGLVIADGEASGTPNRDGSLGAGVLFQDGARLRLVRAERYFANPSNQTRQLLQAGPFLVENGRAAGEFPDQRHARRTFLLTDGDEQWAIGYAPSTTLADLSVALANTRDLAPFEVWMALALDDGSSSAFWVRREHHPFYLRELGKVRNFIGLIHR